jgi:hypothetical protein
MCREEYCFSEKPEKIIVRESLKKRAIANIIFLKGKK